MKIALISCTSSKKGISCKAAEMYSPSPRFSLAYEYAKKIADSVYIISAKYGLLPEDQVIEPYNETLNDKTMAERRVWAEYVIDDLRKRHSLESDEFIILAGKVYNEFLIPYMKYHWLPLEGMSMGRWIPKLRELIGQESHNMGNQSTAYLIHHLFNSLPRYQWDTIDEIPFNNGIYIMYETGEKIFEMDRIVRVGTHNVDGRLKERLKDHFIRKNKDGSILRKNIGLALLHKQEDPFEAIWAQDGSKSEIRRRMIEEDQLATLLKIENEVTDYLHNNIQFTCFKVDSNVDRLRIEGALIATLSKSDDFLYFESWLGNYSPKTEIANSGLWNTQGLDGIGYSHEEINLLKKNIWGGTPIKQDKKIKSVDSEINIPKQLEMNFKMLTSENRHGKTSTGDIRNFIVSLKTEASNKGLTYIEIISGEVHKQLNLDNKMPSVCAAMYQVMEENDIILNTTPSGKSSTIKIRYYLI